MKPDPLNSLQPPIPRETAGPAGGALVGLRLTEAAEGASALRFGRQVRRHRPPVRVEAVDPMDAVRHVTSEAPQDGERLWTDEDHEFMKLAIAQV